jgi:carbamoyl-phosphate synthase large subunit
MLKKSSADRNYLLPTREVQLAEAVRRLVSDEAIDLIIPTTDVDVQFFAVLRPTLPSCLFLPRLETIELCQDKFALARHLQQCGIAVPATVEITDVDRLDEVFRVLRPDPYLWCRVRTGTGSLGATPVRTSDQARAWIEYWEDMRGIPATSFIVSAYLPGRDFACQSLWRDGQLMLLKTTERLSYFQGTAGPSGVSSIGGVHRTVFDSRLAEAAAAAVFAVDADATGAFSVDFKEDRYGTPCITEINVGRFLTGVPIFDESGRHSMTQTYLQLAFREPVQVDAIYDVTEEYIMVRDLDALPDIFLAADAGVGIVDLNVN